MAMNKKVTFGETTLYGDREFGNNSLAQSWWDEDELLRNFDANLYMAKMAQPESETRGLEAHLGNGQVQNACTRWLVKSTVLRHKRLKKMAASIGSSPESAALTLQQYLSRKTAASQAAAHQRALNDEAEAKKIHASPTKALVYISKQPILVSQRCLVSDISRCSLIREISC